MSDLEKLSSLKSLHDLAKLIKRKPKSLSYLLYHMPAEEKYVEFNIPKKSGGSRVIHAPAKKLKQVQKRIANILNNCIGEIENNKSPVRAPLSHGFKKFNKKDSNNETRNSSLGIHSNAKCHRNRRYVLNLDLVDFFPSFNFGRVRGFFISNNDFKLHPSIATYLAQLACHNGGLPQGSPCSPVITNLITHILDVRLAQLAKIHSCHYSRYADDLTFSTNKKEFPLEIAAFIEESKKWQAGEELQKIIERSGFLLNANKTRLQFKLSRQVVTGLVVNKKVNIRKEYYRHARSMCHALFTKGSFFLPSTKVLGSIKQLEGILSHIYFIKEYGRTQEEIQNRNFLLENAKGKERPKFDAVTELYSKFLYFRYFVHLEKPLILCEGKTDIIYLKAAINQLKKNEIFSFPHEIDYFPFTKRISEVMRIHDGTSALKNFIEHYEKSLAFTKQIGKQPVIILIDNDSEANKIIEMLKGKYYHSHITYNRKTHYVYPILKNLFLVVLPMLGGKDNKIEDFLDTKATRRILDNKEFSAENGGKFDNQKHYSKQVLATKIVRPEQESLDFSKFKQILEQLSSAINQYPNP